MKNTKSKEAQDLLKALVTIHANLQRQNPRPSEKLQKNIAEIVKQMEVITYHNPREVRNRELHAEIQKPSPNLNTIQELIEGGADINYKNSNHQTALELAIGNQNLEIVDILLEYGANPNQKTTLSQQTPLELAIGKQNPEIVKTLLSYEADFAYENNQGQNYLEIIDATGSKNGNTTKIRELFFEELLDLSFQNALKFEKETVEIYVEALQAGIQVNEPLDECGNTLFHIAIAQNNAQAVKTLSLNDNLDPLMPNKYGISPSQILEKANQEECNDKESAYFIERDLNLSIYDFRERGLVSNRAAPGRSPLRQSANAASLRVSQAGSSNIR